MMRKLALAAALSLGVAALPAAALAAHGGGGGRGGGGGFGGHGGGGFSGGGFSGGRSFSGPGFAGRSLGSPAFAPRAMPGAVPRNGLVNMNRGMQATPLGGRFVTANGRFAWNGHHRMHGRHVFGLIPGFGYGYYWYYGDCWAWTDDGWANLCVDNVY